jgi:uncharacterized surface protein with fasciclin (FAS1) repeats
MKKMITLYKGLLIVVTGLLLLVACNDPLENSVYKVADVLMIDEYMANPENNLTDYLKIIEKADYKGMLHAYGTYTCFVPTNDAVQAYLSSIGKTIDQLSTEEAQKIAGYHIINDTIASENFIDGRLPAENIQKQYLTTRTLVDDKGSVYVQVDREARILTKDIVLGNGYIHIIDKVLGSSTATIADRLKSLPDRFSFMKELMAQTAVYDTLSTVVANKYYTAFIQDNQTFADLGINSKEDLLVRLRKNSPEISDDAQLLKNFIYYHVVPDRKYVTDLIYASSSTTIVPQKVLTYTLSKDSLFINRFIIGKLNEPGVPVDRSSDYTDLTCSNGVIHEVKGILEIKKRSAYRVYFDLGEQPEIKALKNYRKAGASVTFNPGELSEMTWGGKNNPTVKYYCGGLSYNEKGQYVYGDQLTFRICTNVMQWCEIKLPLLVEGTYNVWICWRRANPGTFRTTFKQVGEEDQVLSTVVDLSSYMPIYYTDAAKTIVDHDKMVQEGWKQYTAYKVSNVMCSKMLGTVKVTSTGRHILRMDALSVSKGDGNYWDMIQFIPVDEDQVWPMVDMTGKLIYKDTPTSEIWPNSAQ